MDEFYIIVDFLILKKMLEEVIVSFKRFIVILFIFRVRIDLYIEFDI